MSTEVYEWVEPANLDPFSARMLKACQAFKDALEQAGQGE